MMNIICIISSTVSYVLCTIFAIYHTYNMLYNVYVDFIVYTYIYILCNVFIIYDGYNRVCICGCVTALVFLRTWSI